MCFVNYYINNKFFSNNCSEKIFKCLYKCMKILNVCTYMYITAACMCKCIYI